MKELREIPKQMKHINTEKKKFGKQKGSQKGLAGEGNIMCTWHVTQSV